jgi:hypothetical protein
MRRRRKAAGAAHYSKSAAGFGGRCGGPASGRRSRCAGVAEPPILYGLHVNVIVPKTSNGYIYTLDNLKDLLGALTGPRFNYI